MKAKEIFTRVRNIPYHCPEFLEDKDNRCWGKNRKLYNLLKENNYKVRFRVCDFYWSKQKFPKQIISLVQEDLDKHLFLEIKINDKWVVLDSSNDSKLPEFNSWDGNTNCKVAVNYEKVYSPEESIILEEQEKEGFKKIFPKYKELYIKINQFLNKIRN